MFYFNWFIWTGLQVLHLFRPTDPYLPVSAQVLTKNTQRESASHISSHYSAWVKVIVLNGTSRWEYLFFRRNQTVMHSMKIHDMQIHSQTLSHEMIISAAYLFDRGFPRGQRSKTSCLQPVKTQREPIADRNRILFTCFLFRWMHLLTDAQKATTD